MKAIETKYKGFKFRSRLEARWAVFFDELGIKWDYEREGYNLNGLYYLPDFYLLDFYIDVEIKASQERDHEDYLNIFTPLIRLRNSGDHSTLVFFGDPCDYTCQLFCWEIDDEGGGPFAARCKIVSNMLVVEDYKDREYYADQQFTRRIPAAREVKMESAAMVIPAALKARQARFEHGELF